MELNVIDKTYSIVFESTEEMLPTSIINSETFKHGDIDHFVINFSNLQAPKCMYYAIRMLNDYFRISTRKHFIIKNLKKNTELYKFMINNGTVNSFIFENDNGENCTQNYAD